MCHPEIPEGAEIPIVTTEEVLVPVPGGDHMPALVALPESGSGPGVLIITDFFGRSAFYELIAARLAQAGCVALLPEPFFRDGPLEEQTTDHARARMRQWNQQRAIEDFGAAVDFLAAHGAVTGDQIGTVGFCLGGTFVMHLACERDNLATVAFYGSLGSPPGPPIPNVMPPLKTRTTEMHGPIIGLWGDQDELIDMADVTLFGDALRARGLDYDQVVYPGLGHGFMAYSGLDEAHPDYELACDAWTKTIAFLRAHLPLEVPGAELAPEDVAERDRQKLAARQQRMTHPGITDETRQYAEQTDRGTYIVGGIERDRPFRIQRLGHIGLNCRRIEESARFYRDVLGFTISDVGDMSFSLTSDELAQLDGPASVYFMRHKADHHAVVLQSRSAREAVQKGRFSPEMTINQMAWQLGSLCEVTDAIRWFEEKGQPIIRTGRDLHGALYHSYLPDPEGTPNEIFYGMEQIGWNGKSLPEDAHRQLASFAPPVLPRPAHFDEMASIESLGVDLTTGYRQEEQPPREFDVSGVLLPRPFRVVGIGPMRYFVKDTDETCRFYVETLGFEVTEVVEIEGHPCTFLRCRDEHHSVAIFPLELREKLPVDQSLMCMSIGMRLADYSQLCAARDFLADNGVKIVELPPEVSPGVDYAFHALDPDGHCLEFYFRMQRVDTDGQLHHERLTPATGEWPPFVPDQPELFAGEVFLGPWG
jgi:dienelactone hydrolase/catechol 2,3-dioxygenase-like lactoylglutathione lyase family enzyme|tara:strand:+ start:2188 stop:4302 length:2115 start_codon:yes stop_codon:yes gene_type:complete